MTYFKVTDSNKNEYYFKHEGGKYISKNVEYIIVNGKLVNIDAYLNSINISSIESISPIVYMENVKEELNENSVITLIKPIDECDSKSLLALILLLSKYGLHIEMGIEHAFTPFEVDNLYADIKNELVAKNEYDKVKNYLTYGVSTIAIIEGNNARTILKTIIGDKDSKKAASGTIRADMGWDITCNGIEIVDDNDNKLSVILPIIDEFNNSLSKQKKLKK